MREIKFRAWYKNDKRIFIDPQMIDFYNKKIGYMQYQTEYMSDTSYSIPVGFEEFEYSELIEWTGLYDKNGEEIYEGDIFHIGSKKILYVVEWIDCGLKGRQIKNISWIGLDYWKDDIEVIGNIYENPELIEEVRQ